jgi:hypothetical protein
MRSSKYASFGGDAREYNRFTGSFSWGTVSIAYWPGLKENTDPGGGAKRSSKTPSS